MMDAMDQFRMLQNRALPGIKAAQPANPTPAVQFGQKVTPMHQQPHRGDVFIKSIQPKPATEASRPTHSLNAALQNFTQKANLANNGLLNALKKLSPASQAANLGATRKPPELAASRNVSTLTDKKNALPTHKNALESRANVQKPAEIQKSAGLKAGGKTLAHPQRSGVEQPTSAQVNTRNKPNIFAGAVATGSGLGALTATVAAPAALVAKPTLMGKLLALLPG